MVLRPTEIRQRRNSEGPQRSARITARDHSVVGGLERWRAAPAEGVHRDEVCHVATCPKFENVKITASVAVVMLIPHLAPLLVLAFLQTLARSVLLRKFDCKSEKIGAVIFERRKTFQRIGGADADRTRDLLNAICVILSSRQ